MTADFGSNVSYMVSPTAYQKNGQDWMRTHMVGTGPFVQTEYKQDVSLTTVKNKAYWEQGKPYLDGVQMIYVVDDLTRMALFKSGGAEILSNGRNGRLASELDAAGYPVIKVLGNGNNSLVPDSMNSDSPWSNLKVRQAAEYAIDKESIAKNLGFGYANALNQMNSPVSIGYDTSISGRNYDIAKAKQLLIEADYPNGFKTTIITSPMTTDRNTTLAIQSYLAKVGIQCELQFPQAAAFSQITTGGWHNALLFMPLQLWSNPNKTFTYFFGIPSTTFQSLKKPDGWKDMLDASKATLAPDPKVTKQLETALYNDATIIPINDSTFPYIISSNNIKDLGIGAFSSVGFWDPANAWISK